MWSRDNILVCCIRVYILSNIRQYHSLIYAKRDSSVIDINYCTHRLLMGIISTLFCYLLPTMLVSSTLIDETLARNNNLLMTSSIWTTKSMATY